jgi:hypothetical protein
MPSYFTPTKFTENIRETPEGFLVCVGVPIARTGEMVYAADEVGLEPDEEGKVILSREEAEVFRPETMASFEGKPVTIGHPKDFVTPENWSWLAKGFLQNVRRGEGDQKNDLIADVCITDAVAINLVKAGLREVSCGYTADYNQEKEGTGTQSNIIGNHLALVEQGRAGASYAINDHKGKVKNMPKLKDAIKNLFKDKKAVTLDEVMKTVDEADKDDKKDDKKTDDGTDKTGATVWDAEAQKKAYDELVEMVKDMGTKIAKLGQPQDAKEDKVGTEVVSDDDTSLEGRLKVVETGLAKLLEMAASKDEDTFGTENTEDEDGDETEDDDFEETTMTGDSMSRAEILAPGIKKSKTLKADALKAAYKTEDGKAVIDSLTNGKPTFDSAEKVEHLFIAASEVLKAKRSADLVKTKQVRDSVVDEVKGEMTAEKINEINAKHYSRK